MDLRLRFFPDPILAAECEPISRISEDFLSLARRMEESLYSEPGLAIAAPQLGVAKRIIILNMMKIQARPGALILINPFIKSSEGETINEEGCLSIPGIFENIARARKVEAEGMDLMGRRISVEAEDIFARVLQHEIDHLDGRLFWDRLPEKKRNKLKGKYLEGRPEKELYPLRIG